MKPESRHEKVGQGKSQIQPERGKKEGSWNWRIETGGREEQETSIKSNLV